MSGIASDAHEGPRGPTGWLHRHRFRIVLWIAVIEGIVAWATHGLHITTIVIVAAIAVASLLLYRFAERRTHSPFLHELVWLLAASQLGATVLVASGVILLNALIILLVIFALVALGLLLLQGR